MKDVIVKIKNYRKLPSGGTIGDSWEEIVRCKDCKNRDECEIVDGCIADKDWFCADGERREADD